MAQTFAPVVSELGNVLGKSGPEDLQDKSKTLQVAVERDHSLEDDSVSSVETEYEYALTDITTDGWKVKK